MSRQIEQLLADFTTKNAQSAPYDTLVVGLLSDAGYAGEFAAAALMSEPRTGTYFDLSLGHVTEPQFARLVESALDILAHDAEHPYAENVIAYASLQFPQLLHPYLPRIFETQINRRSYYENWPWRESWATSQAGLLQALDTSTSEPIRLKAWNCLLECRTRESLDLAFARANSLPLRQPVDLLVREVGFDARRRKLFDDDVWHVNFNPAYFTDEPPSWMARSTHPTWRLAAEDSALRFGGRSPGVCGLCGGGLHHLITLPVSVLQRERGTSLSLACCLSCLGWEKDVLLYSHTDRTQPQSLDRGTVTPKFPSKPLVETAVRLARTPHRWRWQDWALSNGRESLFRVGGHPSWIQNADYPTCASCSADMKFLFQLDSELPTEDGGVVLWGSGGLCYGFWCADCEVSAFTTQYT